MARLTWIESKWEIQLSVNLIDYKTYYIINKF